MNYFLAFCIPFFLALQGGFAQNTKGDKPVWLPKSTPKGKAKPVQIRTQVFRSKALRPVYSNSPRTPKADFTRKQYPPVRNNARPQLSVSPVYENDDLVKEHYKKSQKLYRKAHRVVVITPAMKRVRRLRQRSIESRKGRNYPIGQGPVSFSRPFRGKVRPEVKWGKHHHLLTAITTDLAGSPLRRKNFMSPPGVYESVTTAKGSSSVRAANRVKNQYQKSQKFYKRNRRVAAITPAMGRVYAFRQRSTGSRQGQNYPIGRGPVSFSRPFRGKVRPEVRWGKHHHLLIAITTDLAGSPLRRKNFMSPPGVYEPKTTAKGNPPARESTESETSRPRMSRAARQSDKAILGMKNLFGKLPLFGNPSVKAKPSTTASAFGHPKRERLSNSINGLHIKVEKERRRINISGIPVGSRESITKSITKRVKVSGMPAGGVAYEKMSGNKAEFKEQAGGVRNMRLTATGQPKVEKERRRINISGIPVGSRESITKRVKVSGMPAGGVAYKKMSGNKAGFKEQAGGVRNMRLTATGQPKVEKERRRINISGIPVGSRESITKRVKVSGVLVPGGVAYEKISRNRAGFREPTTGIQSGSRIHSIRLATGSLQLQVKSSAKRGERGNYARISEPKTKYSTGGFIHKIAITSNAKVSPDCVRGTKSREAAYGSIYDNNGSWLGNFFNRLFSRKIPGQKDKPEKLRYDKNERKLWKDLYE